MTTKRAKKIGRRQFIGAAAGAGFAVMKPQWVRGSEANSALRAGLLGCGGRGTVDARNLIDTGKVRITALADLFEDQLEKAAAYFNQYQRSKGFAPVAKSQLFLGPKAYADIANSSAVDVVVIATPPYFHPEHLAAGVEAGKHVYCEKPVGVDPYGVNRVLETGRRAEGKLSLDVGLQVRSAPPFAELMRRIHAGALGTIATGEAYYFGTAIERPSWPNASPAERRLRNWIYDRVLSGDIIVEQDIHAVDVCNWALGSRPIAANATGGRKARTDPGDVYGHYNAIFSYPEDVTVSFTSTQFDRGWWDVNERFFGAKGVSQSHYSGPVAIYGDEAWSWDTAGSPLTPESKSFSPAGAFRDNLAQADAEKMNSFVSSILTGDFHNQAQLGATATLSCILARQAAYSGRRVSWDELLRQNERWESGIDLDRL